MRKIIKNLFLLGLILHIVACGSESARKPENLIPLHTMEAILYDLAIIDGARIADPQGLSDAGLSQQGFIFEKYKIDSLQFAESNSFYTSNIDEYILMYERILKKIETEKTLLDTLVKREKIKSDSITKSQIDTAFKEKPKVHPVFKKKKMLDRKEQLKLKNQPS